MNEEVVIELKKLKQQIRNSFKTPYNCCIPVTFCDNLVDNCIKRINRRFAKDE